MSYLNALAFLMRLWLSLRAHFCGAWQSQIVRDCFVAKSASRNDKNRIFGIVLGCVLFFIGAINSYAQEKNFFGETITYRIKQIGMSGTATLTIDGPTTIEGKEAILITFLAKGFTFFDEEKIYIDPKTCYPIIVKRNLDIFGNKEKIDEYYDVEKGRVRIINSKDPGKPRIIEKGKPIENIYGFIYRQRRDGKLNVGDEFSVQLPTQEVIIKAVDKQKMSVAKKDYEVVFMQGTPRNLKIYFDTGENKIPVRIQGAFGFGSAAMIMTQYGQTIDHRP